MVATVERSSATGEASSGLFARLPRRAMVLVVLGTLFAVLSATCLWSWRTFANSQGFADRAVDMLKEPAVREAVADQIVTALESQSGVPPELLAARPLLKQVVAEVVGTRAFQGIFYAGVRELHSAVFAGNRSHLRVRVDDAGQLVKDAIRLVNPSLAAAIPDSALDVFVEITQSTPADAVMHAADVTTWLIAPFGLLAVLCYLFAFRHCSERRRVTEAIGLALVVAGVLAFVVLAVGIQMFASAGAEPRDRTALRAVFWSITHLVNIEAKVFILAGSVVAVGAAYAGPGRLRDRVDRTARVLWTRFERPGWRAAACLVLIVACLFAMAWPAASAAILVRFLAYVGFVAATVGLLDVIGATAWAEDTSTSGRRTVRRLAKGGVAVVAVTVAVLLLGVWAIVRDLRAPPAGALDITETGCNGHLELCDEPITDVAFAGSHNSMSSSTYEGWFFVRHNGGISAQLARGVRAFLVDLYAGTKFVNVIRTDFATPADQDEAMASLTEDERLETERLLGMLGSSPPKGRRDFYLCHNLCELGSVPAVQSFRRISDFLRENPNEVIILVIEDHVPPGDAVTVLEQSGLADRASLWQAGEAPPTLREMIEQRRQVLVMAENHGGTPAWYHAAYGPAGLLQETGYRWSTPQSMTCDERANEPRGRPGAPLFLVNHWIEPNGPPDPRDAETVNTYGFLEDRLVQCWLRRGHFPNIVAVDFYNRGDLAQAVDALNGLATAPSGAMRWS